MGKPATVLEMLEGNDPQGSEAALGPVAKHLAFIYTLILINKDGKYALKTPGERKMLMRLVPDV